MRKNQNYIVGEIYRFLYPRAVNRTTDEFSIFIAIDNNGNSGVYKAYSGELAVKNSYHIYYHTVNDAKYGETNVVDSIIEYEDFDSLPGIRKFLTKLTSSRIADDIVAKFNTNIVDILRGDAEEAVKQLKTVRNVGNVRANEIVDKFKDKEDTLAAIVALGKFGFNDKQLKIITDFYKDITVAMQCISRNMYELAELDGIRFRDIDEKALNNGYEPNDTRRLVAGISYCFKYALENYGWSYMSQRQVHAVADKCNIPYFTAYIDNAINDMLEKQLLNKTGTKNCLSMAKNYNIERSIMKELIRISNNKIEKIPEGRLQQHLDNLTTYNKDQLEFVKNAANSPLSFLTGSAGTGKTYSVKGVASLFSPDSVYGCALSGRAASNLRSSLVNITCSTIHRAIPSLAAKKPAYSEQCPLENASLIIVDESTMIDGLIFLELLKHVKKGTRLILMGDIKQLPPIGKFQIFHDALLSGRFVYSNLTEPCRQDADSGIIAYAMGVTKGQYDERGEIVENYDDIDETDYNLDEIEKHFFNELEKYQSLLDVQVCMAMRKECDEVNERIHYRLGEKGIIYKTDTIHIKKPGNIDFHIAVGDKLINTRNVYKGIYYSTGGKATCMNGEIGIVKEIQYRANMPSHIVISFMQNDKPVDIIFEEKHLKDFEYGYACTCHKLQGSGFESVIIGMGSGYCKMYTREWFYTSITRAKKYVKIFGRPFAIEHAYKNCETNTKQTFLHPMLCDNKEII